MELQAPERWGEEPERPSAGPPPPQCLPSRGLSLEGGPASGTGKGCRLAGGSAVSLVQALAGEAPSWVPGRPWHSVPVDDAVVIPAPGPQAVGGRDVPDDVDLQGRRGVSGGSSTGHPPGTGACLNGQFSPLALCPASEQATSCSGLARPDPLPAQRHPCPPRLTFSPLSSALCRTPTSHWSCPAGSVELIRSQKLASEQKFMLRETRRRPRQMGRV